MTIAQRIKSLLNKAPNSKPNAWSDGIQNTSNVRAELEMAMVGLVYRCLRKRAQALVDTDFIIGEAVSQSEIKSHDVDHWLVKLLNNPNKEHDAIELRRLTQMWFDANGNAFWLVTVNDLGLPEQIHVIPPPNVTIQFNNGEVIGYKVKMGNAETFVPSSQMIHFRNLEPSLRAANYYLGRSLVCTAIREINIEEESKLFMNRYFENDAQPPLILETPNEIDEAEWQNFKSRWDQRIKNYKLQAVLSGGMKLGVPPSVGVDIKGMSEDIRISLCALMGTPWSYVSGDYAGGLNSSTQSVKDTFNIDEMEPIRRYYASVLTRFFAQYEPNIKVQHVPYAYRDPEESRKQIEFELSNGLATINEVLQREGKEPIGADGDVRFLASGLMPMAQALNPPAPTPSIALYPAQTPTSSNKDYEERGVFWTRTMEQAVKFEQKLIRALQPVFKEMNEAATKIAKKNKEYGVAKKLQPKLYADLFNDPKWTKKMQAAAKDITKAYANKTVSDAMAQLNVNDSLSETFETKLNGAIDSTLATFKSIPETIGTELSTALQKNPTMTAGDLEDLIDDTFSRYGVDMPYAERIAVTTTTRITGAAQRTTYDEFGFTSVWTSQRDGRVRDSHQNADGQEPSEDGYFNVGGDIMQYPASGGVPAENINCRCYLFPVQSKRQ
jgi:HK97 family phage portal protein